jgi:hypothetical protein
MCKAVRAGTGITPATPIVRRQTRTPIVDGAHGEDWIWAYKRLADWWSNPHHDRVGGVRRAPTGWTPGMQTGPLCRAGLSGGRQGLEPAQCVPRPQERGKPRAAFLHRRARRPDPAPLYRDACWTIGTRRRGAIRSRRSMAVPCWIWRAAMSGAGTPGRFLNFQRPQRCVERWRQLAARALADGAGGAVFVGRGGAGRRAPRRA